VEKTQVLSIGRDMLYLVSCAIHGRIPEKKYLDKMDFALIYKMAKFHSMQSIVYICLAKCRKVYGDEIVQQNIFDKFTADYQATVKKLVMFDVEREALCKLVGERGSYLCLKGVVLQHYYPTLGMRQMTDNDILVDGASLGKIREHFVSRGYTVLSYGKGCHDTYCKGPLTFEIHRKLFSSAAKTRLGSDYYKNVNNLLIRGERNGELLFGDDDFYVYFLYHAYKHYATAGCGVRTLADIYVYCTGNKKLDWEYISRQLDLLAISDYERGSRKLALWLFDPDRTPEAEMEADLQEMLLYYLTSGTFGTNARLLQNNVSEVAEGGELTARVKFKYFIGRIFPPFEYYKEAYPKLAKWIIPIPFIWLSRIFRGIKKSKTIADEVNKVKDM
jgi:hypothetical protein